MSTRLQDLAPGVREPAEEALAEMKTLGIPAVQTSTNRMTLEQMAFWIQDRAPLEVVNLVRKYLGMRLLTDAENLFEGYYRRKLGELPIRLGVDVITMADGVNTLSNHQGGHALDVVPTDAHGNAIWPPADDPRWRQIAEVMKRHGFSAGLDWPAGKKDPPHYEMK